MKRRTKIGLSVVGAVVLLGIILSSVAARRGKAVEVRLEPTSTRDLVAIVSASGKIEAKTKVDISADITGRITKIYVREGDLVKAGQLLIQIDPAQYQSVVARAEALLRTNEANLAQVRATQEQARRSLERALEIQRTNENLIARETVEKAQEAYDIAQANFNAARSQVEQARASLQEARDNLAKTRLFAPIGGRVTRLAVEEGEVAVPGTFSRETGLLMTVSDLSVILAKVDVDETDVVRLALGDSVAVSIDAYPDTSFMGRVSKISNSAKLTAATGSTDRAVDFEVEVTLDDPPADIRPDLSATARIVTDTRTGVLSVPIIALTVREHEDLPNELKATAPRDTTGRVRGTEREGVFRVVNGVATFVPVRVGIAGEEYFEVLSGIQEGDTVVAGPYQAIRDMKDSTRVRAQKEPAAGGPRSGS